MSEGNVKNILINPLWNLLAIALACVVITLVGLRDDLKDTKPRGKVSGLGLAVSKNIALEHQARIEVTSQEGEGTEFTIRFPEDPGE